MSVDSRSCYTESYAIFIEPIRAPSPFARTFSIDKSNRPLSRSVLSAFGCGLGAGLVGITAMSITQTIEQHFTGRPAIRVPGESIMRFFRQCFILAKNSSRNGTSSPSSSSGKEAEGKGKDKEHSPMSETEDDSEPSNLTESPTGEEQSACVNAMTKWGAYFGQGALFGGLRGVLSYYGVRGFMTDLVFMGLTSSGDCSFWREITENVPLTQSVLNSLPEIIHQMVFAFVTGFFSDHWVN